MGNNISLSAPLVVRLTTQSALTTKVNLTQVTSGLQSINITNVGAPSIRIVTSTKLAVKLVVGQKGDKGDSGTSPEVFFVGDQISINGVLGPHLTGPTGPLTNIPENITATASSVLGGHRVVQVFNGSASYADKDSDYIGQLGFTMSAYDTGSEMQLFTSGVVTEPTWNFVKGPVFLSNNGMMTQTKPTTGTVILVGRAISQYAMSIQFQQLYRRL